MLKKIILFSLLTLLLSGCRFSQNKGGYLFAHMTNKNYGSMFYSVSEDGINWTTLNLGESINEYRGHPDFCLGKDGSYYMIGVEQGTGKALLWATGNLIDWEVKKELPYQAFDVSEFGYETEREAYGAPKMYYDKDSRQYIITWHATTKEVMPQWATSNDWWRAMRTFYILTSDFETFAKPQRLFQFTGEDENMATLDVIIRKIDDKYYAFIKDERWPDDISKGAKAIHIAKSNNLTGPYENPGDAITDSWHEAPTLVPKPDNNGWYLFVEKYPHKYVLYEASSIEGKWTEKEMNAPNARHGSIIWINSDRYRSILKAYNK